MDDFTTCPSRLLNNLQLENKACLVVIVDAMFLLQLLLFQGELSLAPKLSSLARLACRDCPSECASQEWQAQL